MGRQGGEDLRGKAAAGGPGKVRWCLAEWVVPHLRADKLGGTTGE